MVQSMIAGMDTWGCVEERRVRAGARSKQCGVVMCRQLEGVHWCDRAEARRAQTTSEQHKPMSEIRDLERQEWKRKARAETRELKRREIQHASRVVPILREWYTVGLVRHGRRTWGGG